MKINDIEIDPSDCATPELAAVQELLRQRAVALEFLEEDAENEAISAAIERLLEQEVDVPDPAPEECQRWYEANKKKYRNGDLIHARHILFQVTEGTPVPAVRSLAEAMLGELRANPELFEERAKANSNCPSGANGGQLGQLQRGSTVPEFEKAIFDGTRTGILPELVQTRHGFHIVAVDERIPGEQLPFEAVAKNVADEMRKITEEQALGQYMRLLAGQAYLDGVELDSVASPLVQ